jgi:glycosyltransferase involved in cell wall biosynthesis
LSDWLPPARITGNAVIHIREPFRNRKLDFFHSIFTGQMRKYANQIIAISQDNARRIGIENKTEVVYDHSEVISELSSEISYHSKKVLYLGGSEKIKGFYQMVDALDFIENDIYVYFGGSYLINKSEGKLKRLFRFFNFDDKIKERALKKMRSSSNSIEIGLVYDVPKYLQEVCCLVSPFDKPHFSLPVIEAFAYHKPVIVTDVEGANEVVKNGVNGLIVKKNDPKELARAINYICNNANLAQKMGENGFKDAKEKFSATNMDKIADIYDRL